MKVVVINTGSSSLKFSLFESAGERLLLDGQADWASPPARLTVRRPGKDSVTDLDGSQIRHNVVYTDHEFTPEGLTEVSAPPSAAD